jgi:hypothetical protein
VLGLNEHLGGAVVGWEPLRVMLLQESVTPALNPPVGAGYSGEREL